MTRTQSIRHECLLQLYGSRMPLSVAHIYKVCKREGEDFAMGEIMNELTFLVGQQFAVHVPNIGTGEIRYQITSAGVLHWENVEGQ